ncbi:hypothetical protein tinsulaeT_15670 [Thalassotalea insulae]|uniref:histidine kinase n=1 Tax=Thalassotalea insulae TaxID=2056778 RepID=A0ABQ6GU85_9GAMM|nr:ATP-binding protein [Thalassotalea insulae]GLX78227.1 hypothetical protein tinsulaeT_15670 [Thalassotalea insulae]
MPIKLIQLITLYLCLNSAVGGVFSSEVNHASPNISQERVLRIALPDDATLKAASPEPFERVVNFLKEYWQIWAIDHQVEVRFIYLPTTDALTALKQNQLDIVAINIYQSAEQQLLFSIPYLKFRQSIFRNVNKNTEDGIQIAIHAQDTKALNFLPSHIEREYFNDVDALVENYHKYDAIYSTRPWIIANKLEQFGINQNFYINQQEVPQVTLHFTTRADDRALMYLINDSIRAVKTSQANVWNEKYQLTKDSNFILTFGQYGQNLSEQEKQYLINNNVIHYPVANEGNPPFIITKSFANITDRGFTTELLRFIAQKTGVIFKPLYVENREQLERQIEQGKAQLLVDVEQNNKSHYQSSIPYFTIRYSLAYNPSITTVERFADLNQLSIAAVKEAATTARLAKKYPLARISLYDTTSEAINAVAEGKAQVFVGSSLTTSFLIKENRYANLTSRPFPQFDNKTKLVFATSNEHSQLVSIINKAINALSTDQFDAMYAKWSQSAFPEANVQAQVEIAYRQASYVFLTILLIALIVFWVYYRQLQVQKTAQKKIEHALALAESARKEAEKSAQAKVTFLTHMSHEIRTPMNGVLGMTEALNYTKLNSEQSELLETLEGSARHLLALLNDVLDFSKMEAGKLTLESMPVNLRLLSQNVIKSFQHIEKNNDIKLKLNIDSGITHSYFTDPTRLNQVLNNLMSNAIKFTDQGSITLSITKLANKSQADKHYDTIRISVSDTGIGIPPEKQKLLFTPFIQADSDTTRKFGGTGLGLSICQEIVIAMGGMIKIESQKNQGSNFYFDLTFKQAEIKLETTDRRRSDRNTSAPADNRFADIRVLVAEDNLVNVKVLTAQLARLNIEADVAYDGEQALAMHQQAPYDIIISDCHMPKMDGFELAKAIRKQPPQAVWLIAVTADALSGAAENCLAAGFDDYMAKPCPQEEITNKLNHAYRMLQTKRNG